MGVPDGFWIGWLDLLDVIDSHSSGLQAIQHYRCSTQFTVHCCIRTSRILATDLSQSHCNFNSHMRSSWHRLIPFLLFLQLPIPKTRLSSIPLLFSTPLKVKVILRPAVSRPVYLGRQAPIWGLRPDFYNYQTVAGLLMWGALSDERTGLPFAIGAGPRPRSHSWIRVPRDSWRPYFTVWD
jgi:hypothetical protein